MKYKFCKIREEERLELFHRESEVGVREGASPSGSGSESSRVAASPSRRRSGFPGLRYRFGAPLHFAPSPSNPSRATAP